MAENKKLLIAVAGGVALIGGALLFAFLSGKSES